MKNEIVKSPVLGSDMEILAPIGTKLTHEIIYQLGLAGVDTIETYNGTLRIPDVRWTAPPWVLTMTRN